MWERLAQRLRREERGSVLVVVAIALTAIFGLAALSTDVGRLYVMRQRLSAVADAAALAGGERLPADPTGAVNNAIAYLQKNNIDPARATIALTESNHKISVTIDDAVPMTFARIVGHSQEPVSSSATAWATPISGVYGAVPLGVARADWVYGQLVYLKMDASTGTVSPGNYQALALGRTGASTYESNLANGYPGWIRMGNWIDTQTGNMATPTVRGVNTRISQDPYSTYTTVKRQSPRLVKVPILADYNVNGSGQVNVVGFAMFFLEQGIDEGNEKGQIVGRFVKMMTEGEANGSAPDYGLYAVKLTQ
jgi:Flp pilus assembly protein TadG